MCGKMCNSPMYAIYSAGVTQKGIRNLNRDYYAKKLNNYALRNGFTLASIWNRKFSQYFEKDVSDGNLSVCWILNQEAL